ncbi:MAG: type III pantothenate kinase [Candidatus Omnitrophica bacterium]|nr:type III pantothenate kinase [Candidatus Omnitrophota bacterium]
MRNTKRIRSRKNKKTSHDPAIILIDAGNTSATYGIYRGGRLLEHGSCIHNDIPKLIQKINKSGLFISSNVVLSSVVPEINLIIHKTLKKYNGTRLWVAGKNLPVPVHHKYRYKNKLGIDRLVNIFGALKIYKGPLLMIDFGTAITADYVSKQGVFEGGMIIPGPEIAFQALLNRAALIPKNLELPKNHKAFLGRTTYDCMRSGILEGYGAMTDELITRFKKRYGQSLKVIATGGFTKHLKSYVNNFEAVDPLHSIKSLLLLFKEHIRSN